MSEATVFEHDVPDGWYDDPAKPGMQRWWSGTDWSDHVRYSDRAKPVKSRALEAVTAPQPVFAPAPAFAFAAQPAFETQPAFAQLSIAAPAYEPPAAAAQPALSIAATPAVGVPAISAPAFSAPATIVAATITAPTPFTHFPAESAALDFGAARMATTIPDVNAYVPMRSLEMGSSASAQFYNMRRFTPSTAGAWLLAFSPLLWIGLVLLGGMMAIAPLLVTGGLAAVLCIAALADHATLSRRGMQSASVGWFFLGVLPYLVVRSLVLRREGVRHMSPAVAFVASMAASVMIALFLPVLTGF